MSIEQKIAQILAESKAGDAALNEDNKVTRHEQPGDQAVIRSAKEAIDPSKDEVDGEGHEEAGDQTPIRSAKEAIDGPAGIGGDNEANKEGFVKDQHGAANGGPGKKANKVTEKETDGDKAVVRTKTSINPNVKEDIDALVNGEDLTEEFKAKAATIFEAAIVSRVKDEVARLEEEFDAKLEEAVAQNQEGLVEKVDGYLDYVVEQWMQNNEIALESGMKSEVLEGFVSGLKGLFEEHYIDIPEEKFDVLGSLEETVADLQAKLDEQVAANVELNKALNESVRDEIIGEAAEGLAETDKEKFFSLSEELSFEDADTFSTKIQTIRENYFTNKASTIVESVITDTPVEALTEAVKSTNPSINRYLSALNNLK
jgi:hypothetical protein